MVTRPQLANEACGRPDSWSSKATMRPTTMMARVPTTRARRWRFELGSVPVWGGAAGPVGSRPAMAAVRSVSRLPSDLAMVAPELGPSHRAGDEAGAASRALDHFGRGAVEGGGIGAGSQGSPK